MQQGNGTYLREICILLLRCKSKKMLDEHEGGDKDNVCSYLLILEIDTIILMGFQKKEFNDK